MQQKINFSAPSATGGKASFIVGGSTTAGRAAIALRRTASRQNARDAVHKYLSALKSLGRENISSVEIASALRLDHRDVMAAIKDLESKGVNVK
jgi:hypothetical protein